MRKTLDKIFANREDKIIDVIELINNNELKTAFITDENKKLLGIVTDGDIRRAILKDIPLTESVEKVMVKKFYVAKIGLSDSEILEILMENKILIIPILNERKQVIDYYHITDFIKEEYLRTDVKADIKPEKSKIVLITGGAGYIGSTLVRLLLKKGYSVRILDNLIFGRESLGDLTSNPDFELIKGDYTQIDQLIPCLKNVSSVIHLAAIVGDPAGNIDPELTKETNFYGVKILAKGGLTKKLTIKANKFSQKARSEIESVGGKIEVV